MPKGKYIKENWVKKPTAVKILKELKLRSIQDFNRRRSRALRSKRKGDELVKWQKQILKVPAHPSVVYKNWTFKGIIKNKKSERARERRKETKKKDIDTSDLKLAVLLGALCLMGMYLEKTTKGGNNEI